jgi:hypothetical protein
MKETQALVAKAGKEKKPNNSQRGQGSGRNPNASSEPYWKETQTTIAIKKVN